MRNANSNVLADASTLHLAPTAKSAGEDFIVWIIGFMAALDPELCALLPE